MNRREIIRLAGLALVAVCIHPNPPGIVAGLPAAVESRGTLYRGTRDGDIHASQDGGRTWALHSRFGPQMAIKEISTDQGGQVTVHMEYQGWPIQLGLAKSGAFWETV